VKFGTNSKKAIELRICALAIVGYEPAVFGALSGQCCVPFHHLRVSAFEIGIIGALSDQNFGVSLPLLVLSAMSQAVSHHPACTLQNLGTMSEWRRSMFTQLVGNFRDELTSQNSSEDALQLPSFPATGGAKHNEFL
jgi:hypothetical protein